MICLKAYAKINWTLDILGTRSDGYHLMDMLMQGVEIADTLWLEADSQIHLEGAGNAPKGGGMSNDALSSQAVPYDQSNLVCRAALALQTYTGVKCGARIRLEKHIPSGAGMGGGSADAAATLIGLNRLWGLGLGRDELFSIGLSLGADVPFLLTGGLARVGGIGEAITPLHPAPRVPLVLLQPCGGLSTGKVFAAYDALSQEALPRPHTQSAQHALLAGDLIALGRAMGNVLEAASRPARPVIAQAAQALEALGAVRAMMTGSGSVVYGVFDSDAAAQSALCAMAPQARAQGWGAPLLTHTRCVQTAL